MGVLERVRSKKVFFGADNEALVRIIIINVLITAILFFIRSVYQLSKIDLAEYQTQVADWFVLPADLGKLASRPWTLLTFMFSHVDLWSLIANMLWLWAFGFIIQSLLGGRKLAPLYIYGGLAGALAYIVCSSLIPSLSPNISKMAFAGAHTCVIAIAVAATVAAPNYRIFPMLNGGIPLWVLTVIYAIINFAGVSYGNPAAYGAQLAGAAMGFLFINRLNHGQDPGRWMNNVYDWFFDLFNPDKEPKPNLTKRSVFYDTQGKQPFNKKPNINQQRIDEILDKINQTGYHNLSSDEKEILRRASEEEL